MLNVEARNLGKVAVLSLQGAIVIGLTENLRSAVQSLPKTDSVILDLSRVTAVDAHGLGVLLQLREQINGNGACFELMNVKKPLRDILKITRLDSVFHIKSSVAFAAGGASTERAPVAA